MSNIRQVEDLAPLADERITEAVMNERDRLLKEGQHADANLHWQKRMIRHVRAVQRDVGEIPDMERFVKLLIHDLAVLHVRSLVLDQRPGRHQVVTATPNIIFMVEHVSTEQVVENSSDTSTLTYETKVDINEDPAWRMNLIELEARNEELYPGWVLEKAVRERRVQHVNLDTLAAPAQNAIHILNATENETTDVGNTIHSNDSERIIYTRDLGGLTSARATMAAGTEIDLPPLDGGEEEADFSGGEDRNRDREGQDKEQIEAESWVLGEYSTDADGEYVVIPDGTKGL